MRRCTSILALRPARPRDFSSLASRKSIGQEQQKHPTPRSRVFLLSFKDRPTRALFHLLEQPPLHGRRNRLAAIPDVELLQDIGDMVLDGVGRDVQLRSDHFIG